VQETRLWDANSGKTVSMRGKEEAHDYRYFPDPDLLPLVVDDQWVERLRAELPELPAAKRARFMEQYGLGAYDAEVLSASRQVAEYFEAAAAAGAPAKKAANWVTSELMGALHAQGLAIGQSPVPAAELAALIKLVEGGRLSSKMAKDVFAEMFAQGKAAREVVEAKGLEQVSDAGELEGVLREIFQAHPEEVAQYQAGKKKLMGFFVGQVMKRTQGQANPKLVNELVQKLLEG
jgi:aspartyl-tRNA(Asn)/glutamyl-tRNA(Gln) amidotransferase subunit B